jgi:SAM-dependent methyltransferase
VIVGERIDDLRQIYPHLLQAHTGEGLEVLDESLLPRPPTLLIDKLAGLQPTADWRVLDVGCGRGDPGSRLAQEFGFRVIGVDAVAFNLEQAAGLARERGVERLMIFACGDIRCLPFGNGSFDLVWSRDMLSHISDPFRALNECARVLTAGQPMLIHTSLETRWMGDTDRERVYGPLTIAPEGMSRKTLEKAAVETGFEIETVDDLGGEFAEYNEEHEGRAGRDMIRAARMIRAEERSRAELGERYETLLALYLWRTFHLLGKLSTFIYVLRKR